jgi:hypothetical protein
MGTTLSLTRFATYDPVDVRESAPKTTPPSNVTATIVVYTNDVSNGLDLLGYEKKSLTPVETSPSRKP